MVRLDVSHTVAGHALALQACLAACGTAPAPGPSPPDTGAAAGCRATRGIVYSGTAARRAACRSDPAGAPVAIADRGIGGTGAPPSTQLADRGIGGTGIVGVITGFASVCLGGVEVALGQDAPIEAGRKVPQHPAILRAGQVAAVEAGGGPTALAARRITVRHEVIGPVERVETDGAGHRVLTVAGQRVLVPGPVWGETPSNLLGPAIGSRSVACAASTERSRPHAWTEQQPNVSQGRILLHGRLGAQGHRMGRR